MKQIALALLLSLVTVQSAAADITCRPCPFNCRQLGIDERHCSYRDRRYNQCCVDLDDDGKEMLRDYDRSAYGGRPYNDRYDDRRDDRYDDRRDDRYDDRYDDRHHHPRPDYSDWRHGNRPPYDPRRQDPGAYDDRAGYNPGDCPPGFHVNDRKCTDDERRRGCMDQHSPSGQTCVGWRNGRR